MYTVCKPTKVAYYLTTASNKKTPKQVKQETGCDIVINGSLYNMSTFKPVSNVKANKKVLSDSGYTINGYGWNNGSGNLVLTSNMAGYDNFISCVCLVSGGAKHPLYGTAGMEGVRGRTAIGFRKDGCMIIYCSQDGQTGSYGACTLEALRDKMYNLGCVSAINLDGGGSSQFLSETASVTTSRKVQNYLCIWTEKTTVAVNNGKATTTNVTEINKKYKVTAALNVRSGASINYSIMGTLKKDAQVNVTKLYDGWGYVASSKGWVPMSYLTEIKATTKTTTTTPTVTTTKYKVTAKTGLRVRKGAGTSYTTIKCLPLNTVIEISKTSNGWGYIPKHSGWVSMTYVKKA